MGLFGMLKNSATEALAKQKEKQERAYMDAITYAEKYKMANGSEASSYNLEYALRKYEEFAKKMDMATCTGYLRAIRETAKLVDDRDLMKFYDEAYERGWYNQQKILAPILFNRGLLERENNVYIRTWK